MAHSFPTRRSSDLGLAVISLVNIPVGTALGIYTMKFFRSEAGVRIYGGNALAGDEKELQDAMNGAKPLMNFAERFK